VPHAERDDLHAAVRGQQAVTAGLALPCGSAATMEGNVNKIFYDDQTPDVRTGSVLLLRKRVALP